MYEVLLPSNLKFQLLQAHTNLPSSYRNREKQSVSHMSDSSPETHSRFIILLTFLSQLKQHFLIGHYPPISSTCPYFMSPVCKKASTLQDLTISLTPFLFSNPQRPLLFQVVVFVATPIFCFLLVLHPSNVLYFQIFSFFLHCYPPLGFPTLTEVPIFS